MTSIAASSAPLAPSKAFATGMIQDGTYQITNKKYTALYAYVADGNIGTALTSSDRDQDNKTYWSVKNTNLHGQYTITPTSYTTFAGVGANPSVGDVTKEKSGTYSWIVTENVGAKGQYFISVVNQDLYWNLASSTAGNKVALSDGGDEDSQWQFSRISTGGNGPISDGTYQISNAKWTTLGYLASSNVGTAITESTSTQDIATKWIVNETNISGQYTIENFKYQDLYAYVGANAGSNTPVKGQNKTYSWVIKENGTQPGQYFITLTTSDQGWSLADNRDGTTVTLSDAGDDACQWVFTPTTSG